MCILQSIFDQITAKMKIFICASILAFATWAHVSRSFADFYDLLNSFQAGALTPEQGAKLKESYKVCLESSKAEQSLVKDAHEGKFTEDSKLDDFFTCMFKRHNFIDETGKLNVKVIKEKIPPNVSSEAVEKFFKTCAKVQQSPPSKLAKEAYKCYLTETPFKIQLIAQ